MNTTLHITNGDSLNERLLTLKIAGDFAVWREMLCEGKTAVNLASEAFKKVRLDYFKKSYPEQAATYEETFGSQLAIIADAHLYEEIVLWFEYDLFCHINMLACISFLKMLGFKGDIFLVCSGWVAGEKELKGLAQLTESQLTQHYTDKVLLDNHDLFLADDLWRMYCGNDPLKLKPQSAKDSNFKYLSNCLSAHKERFPHLKTGLNTLETNMLRLIRKYEIRSERQLCGYMLNYQGYYGYGDLQVLKMIARMRPFFKKENDLIVLTKKANAILDDGRNVFKEMKYACTMGGVSKYAYQFNEEDNTLTKI